jgi:uncharacterized protein
MMGTIQLRLAQHESSPQEVRIPEGHHRLEPPPEGGEYPTREDALNACHSWARARGYDVSISTVSQKSKGKTHALLVQCKRAGKPTNSRRITEETRIRKRASNRTGCGMGIWMKMVDKKLENSPWTLRYQDGSKSFVHNHPPMDLDENGKRRKHNNKEKEQSHETKTVRAAHGHAFVVHKGLKFKVVDVYGQQVVDFMAWPLPDGVNSKPNLHHKVSMSYTRYHLSGATPMVGECLWTNRDEPLLKITVDTCKVHDMTFMSCFPELYEKKGLTNHRSCASNIAEVMAPWGMRGYQEIADPFNIFQNTPNYSLKALNPSRPGDYIEFEALQDCVCAVSCCPYDLDGFNGNKITDIAVVLEKPPKEMVDRPDSPQEDPGSDTQGSETHATQAPQPSMPSQQPQAHLPQGHPPQAHPPHAGPASTLHPPHAHMLPGRGPPPTMHPPQGVPPDAGPPINEYWRNYTALFPEMHSDPHAQRPHETRLYP